MLGITISGSPATHASPPAKDPHRRSSAWRSIAWRGALGRHTVPTRSVFGPTPPCGGVATQAYAGTLASEPVASDVGVRPGSDLTDMCTLQLGMLYQLLARAGTNYSSLHCTVYARTFTAVGPGQVKLVRAAQFPIIPGQSEDLLANQQQHATLLLHTEQSWALQGGSAAVDPSAMIEDCLLHREVVALPSSSALVFPLVECGVLVGLLVVELETPPFERGEQERERGRQEEVETEWERRERAGWSGGGAAVRGGGGVGTAGGPGMAPPVGRDDDRLCVASSSLELDACAGHSRTRRMLTDEELQCLRLAVPLLSKACGMDARASWQLAQSCVGAAAARGLLREAQRPLSTLNTFSSMLIPRLQDGDPNKDMAKGILLQGKRLQDLMWQLEDALHGPTAPGTVTPGIGTVLSNSIPVGWPPGAVLHPPAMSAPPFRTPSALPRDPSPAVQELLQLPRPRLQALPPGPSHALVAEEPVRALAGSPGSVTTEPTGSSTEAASHTKAEEETSSSGSSSGSSDSRSGEGSPATLEGPSGPAPVHPGLVTFVERSSPEAPATLADGAMTPFTIRQPPGLMAGGRPSPESTESHSHSHRGHQAVGSSRLHAGAAAASRRGPGAAMATIDVEMETTTVEARQAGAGPGPGSASGKVGSALSAPERRHVAGRARSSASSSVTSSAHLSDAGGNLALVINTNLVTALTGVLTAACRLAAVTGIGFIVNSPLSTILPRRTGGSGGAGDGAGSRSRPSAAAASSGGAGATVAGASGGVRDAKPRLIPRPVRPLLVGVRPALVQKVVGYVLDIALQCTPRAGQVCVSARQDGAGVQVQVLHSGRMDVTRLHARSRSLAGSAAVGAAAAAATGPTQAAAPALRGAPPGAAAASAGRGTAGAGGTAAVAVVPQAARAVHGTGVGAQQAGSGVLSVELAQELTRQAGGHLTVSYPFNMVNARSGTLDMGTSVEIWLPGPAGAAVAG